MTEYEELREKIAEVIHPEYERDKEEGNACLECVRAGKKADEILAITLKEVGEWLDGKGYSDYADPADLEDFLAGVEALKRGEMPEEAK